MTVKLSVVNPQEWDVEWRSRTADAKVRGAGTVDDEFLGKLLAERWEIDAQMTAVSRPQRRELVSREVLDLKVTTAPGEVAVALARHPSGAITFHLPTERIRRTSRGTARSGPEELRFSIPAKSGQAGGERRGLVSTVLCVFVAKLTKIVIDKATEWVLPVLAKKLEQTLWSGRKTGWLRVTKSGLLSGKLEPATPSFAGDQRGLLLIHGTFSHASTAFKGLAEQGFIEEASRLYGDRIFAFNHFSFSESLEANALALLNALPNRPFQFDVVTHSRGGLLLRTLAEPNVRISPLAHRFRLGRAVLGAAPNEGTPLATPGRWEQTLGWFANLMELFPIDNPLTSCAGWISGSLSWLAQHIAGDLPGLESMDMQGPVVAELQAPPGPSGQALYYALAANFAPEPTTLARFADMGVDTFFAGANDLVVPTEGGWRTGASRSSWIPTDRIGCFGIGGNLLADQPSAVQHLNIMARPETKSFLLRALQGQDLGLAPMNSLLPLPRRGAAAVLLPTAPVPEATAVLPAAVVAPAAAVAVGALAAAAADRAASVIMGTGWNEEEALHLIVLPPHSYEQTESKQAQMLASYGSARVLESFRLAGRDEGAGERWRKIIDGHKQVLAFAEGKDITLSPADIEAFGKDLFDTLFPKSVRRLYDQARYSHRRRRLNLVFTSMIPWVADIPWEFAYDAASHAYLASGDVRFVRNVLTAVPADRIDLSPGPLKVLVVSAQPVRTVALSLDEERSLILRAFQSLIDEGLIEVEALPQASPATLHAQVRANQYDVLHFMGHGEFDKQTNTGYLIFEDAQRNVQRVRTAAIQQILRGRGIRLIFLNACETGRGGNADYNSGVAPGLVADGIPAVVANQYSVLDRSATTFAQHFYWCLAQGLSLGDAAREARISLSYTGGGIIDWAVPVLFARNPDACLCSCRAVSYRPPTVAAAAARRGPTKGATTIAVWDVSDTIPDLEQTLEQMNRAQDQFVFRLVNLTAPYGTWSPKTEGGRRYLRAEHVARRLRGVIADLGSDYLLCVTDLPLADREWSDLYLWAGDDELAEFKDNRVIIFSIADFDPPLTGGPLQAAIANVAVAALADALAPQADFQYYDDPASVFFFNAARRVSVLTGQQYLDKPNRRKLQKHLAPQQLKALEALLGVFHSAGPQTEASEAEGRDVGSKRRKSDTTRRSKPKTAATRTPPRKRSRKRST